MSKVRTRFAPSPTGFLHIGSLRTVVFDYLLAKREQGKFILRIEDTDQKRQVKGAVKNLIEILDWLGIKFDEGPGVGGKYGPYIQTERLDIYKKYIEKLVEKGEAYYCFCSENRLKRLREAQIAKKQAPRYDNHCRSLSKEEVEAKIKKGEKFVIRQKMPLDGKTEVFDELRGKIEFDNKELEDQILMKTNQIPTYQFASVVDDHLMKISDVIRGAEWISSFPKNILLYKAFGWQPPRFIHIPLTMSPKGGKLSKRDGDTAVEDYKNKGYLPEALINFSALLGWHPKDNREVFLLEELVKEFSLKGMGISSAVFDIKKLKWLNGEHIRRKSLEDFHNLVLPYYKEFKNNFNFLEISRVLQKRTEILSEIPEMIKFFNILPKYDINLFENKKMKTDKQISLEALKKSISVLENIKDWNEETIKEKLLNLVKEIGCKNGQALWPIRIALSGKQFTPGGAIEIAFILGKKECIQRIKIGIKKLGLM
ncbi:MAG: glutamate--tRNA ligase [Xanthomonadaceae bacterium]|nr:glutamate--tRNA ligase [Rhodospirillaceae bacterium]NIA17715.1 glutamate--tRNA ligase [Xanthomonadaceae bacterium]